MNTESASEISEWIAIDAFRDVMESRFGKRLNPSEHRKRPDEPPDFRYIIDGIEYGVEITMIPDGSRDRHWKIESLKTSILKQCKMLGINCGRVSLRVQGQPPIPNCKKKSELRKLTESLMAMARAFEAGEEHVLCTNGPQNSIVLKKLGDDAVSEVTLSGITFGEFEEETRSKVAALIRASCNSKRIKLENKGFPASRCILLLFSDYSASETHEVREDTARMDELRSFHTVGWIPGFRPRRNELRPDLPGRFCEFLWTVNDEWRVRIPNDA